MTNRKTCQSKNIPIYMNKNIFTHIIAINVDAVAVESSGPSIDAVGSSVIGSSADSIGAIVGSSV